MSRPVDGATSSLSQSAMNAARPSRAATAASLLASASSCSRLSPSVAVISGITPITALMRASMRGSSLIFDMLSPFRCPYATASRAPACRRPCATLPGSGRTRPSLRRRSHPGSCARQSSPRCCSSRACSSSKSPPDLGLARCTARPTRSPRQRSLRRPRCLFSIPRALLDDVGDVLGLLVVAGP